MPIDFFPINSEKDEQKIHRYLRGHLKTIGMS